MLEGLTPPVKLTLCKVGQKHSDLSAEDQAIFNQALKDPRWSSASLTKALQDRGMDLGETALRKHRDGKCGCFR